MIRKQIGSYRASLTEKGVVRYYRGTLQDVLTWLKKQTAGKPETDFSASVSPVRFLLPWERRNG